MKNRNIILALLLAVTTFIGCRKDTEEFVINDENIYQSNLVGIVSDESNNPIAGATVNFQGETTTTDQYGFYQINGVNVGDQHNFITITKPGYFDGCRTFRTDAKRTLTHRTQLLRADFANTFSGTSGGNIVVGDVELSFPANAIVNDATGATYAGNVKVAVRHIDPIDENSAFQMPGDLSAIGDNNQIELLRSYGMVYVELQSASGEKLQVKEGSTVKMTCKIPAELVSEAPSEIPMWHFNQQSGLWQSEGIALKQGNKYEAEVPHFSCWNYDAREESIILSSRVVDENGNPLSSLHILVSAVDAQWGGHGNTNSDGSFSGRVTKGKLLNISLIRSGSGNCRGNQIQLGQVGPFGSDTKMADIVVSTSTLALKSLLVTGSFVDCDNQPLANGIVSINGQAAIVINGYLNMAIPYCGTRESTLDVLAIDRVKLKDSRNTITVTSDIVNLGTITVCDDDAEFVEVKNTNLNINQLITTYLSLSGNGQDSSFLSAYRSDDQTYIYFSFDSGTQTEGTFTITNGSVYIAENNGAAGFPKMFSLVTSGTITVVNNTPKSRQEGSYTMTISEGTSTETFTGNFRIKY